MSFKFKMGLLAMALFVLGTSIAVWRHDLALVERLAQAEMEMAKMRADHDCAIQAADTAMKLRDEINEQYQRNILETEKILADHPDFSCIVIPDDLRLRIEGKSPAPDNSAAAGDAAPGREAAKP